MGWIVLIGIIIAVIIVIWDFISGDIAGFTNIAIACLPLIAFTLAVGLLNLKRFSKTGGRRIIAGMILTQIITVSINAGSLSFGFVLTVVALCVVYAIPSFIAMAKSGSL